MKKLDLNQMEKSKGGTSGRGCMLAGAASVIACAIPGVGLGVGIGIFAAAALGDCFYAVPTKSRETVNELGV